MDRGWQDAAGGERPEAKQVGFLFMTWDYENVFVAAVSFSAILEVILLFLFASVGDFGNYRKGLLLWCNLLLTMMLLLISFFGFPKPTIGFRTPADTLTFNLWMTVISSILFGFMVAIHSSFLPVLGYGYPAVMRHDDEYRGSIAERFITELSVTGTISFIIGAFIWTIIRVIVDSSGTKKDVGLAGAALWTFLVGSFACCGLQAREGKPVARSDCICGASIREALIVTCSAMGSLRQYRLYIIGTFFVLMGARGQYDFLPDLSLHLSTDPQDLDRLRILLNVWAIVGISFALLSQRCFQTTTRQILIYASVLVGLTPLYGVIAREIRETYAFMAILGMPMGVVIAYSRAAVVSLLPQDHEAKLMGIYGFTRFAPLVGYALFAGIKNATNFGFGYASMMIPFVLGIPCYVLFDRRVAEMERLEYEVAEQSAAMELENSRRDSGMVPLEINEEDLHERIPKKSVANVEV